MLLTHFMLAHETDWIVVLVKKVTRYWLKLVPRIEWYCSWINESYIFCGASQATTKNAFSKITCICKMAAELKGAHFKILTQGIYHWYSLDPWKRSTYWPIPLKQIAEEKWHGLGSILQLVPKLFRRHLENSLTVINVIRNEFLLTLKVGIQGIKWWLTWHSDGEIQSGFVH